MSAMREYAIVGLTILFSVSAASLFLVLGSRRSRRTTNLPFEFGSRTGHKTWVQFRVRYAVLALLFVAFDMEMVYMFPWAVVFKKEGLIAFFDMFVFVAILVAALVYAWKEKAFDWEK